jgi:hypothetical protein
MEPPVPEAPLAPGPSASPAAPSPAYTDRSTGLVVFGIIEIIGGGLAALMVPFMLLGAVLARKGTGEMPRGGLVMGMLTYGLLAAVLVTLGIGSTMARRWARALNLILSWIWLIAGILVTVALTAFMPSTFLAGMRAAAQQNPNAGDVSTGVMAVILTFIIVFMAIFLIFLPLAFLLFYRSRNVEETCRHRDSVERWTDRRPLPVIAVALLAASGTVYYLLLGFSTPLFPFFGRYLTGARGTIAFLVFAIVDAYVAISFFRLKVAGWWVAVVALTLRMVSSAITIRHADLTEAYSRMGWSQMQLEAMRSNPMFRGGAFLWWSFAFMVIYMGFLLWLKRYFRPAAPPGYPELIPAESDHPQLGS